MRACLWFLIDESGPRGAVRANRSLPSRLFLLPFLSVCFVADSEKNALAGQNKLGVGVRGTPVTVGGGEGAQGDWSTRGVSVGAGEGARGSTVGAGEERETDTETEGE